MRVIITGSRYHADRELIERVILREVFDLDFDEVDHEWGNLPREVREMVDLTIVHGGAPGADRLAADIAQEFGLPTEVHHADWGAHGPSAGPIRNEEMVSSGADLCLAFPFGVSVGTNDCIRRARAHRIATIVTYPDGKQVIHRA